jgi:hypothetical protein
MLDTRVLLSFLSLSVLANIGLVSMPYLQTGESIDTGRELMGLKLKHESDRSDADDQLKDIQDSLDKTTERFSDFCSDLDKSGERNVCRDLLEVFTFLQEEIDTMREWNNDFTEYSNGQDVLRGNREVINLDNPRVILLVRREIQG